MKMFPILAALSTLPLLASVSLLGCSAENVEEISFEEVAMPSDSEQSNPVGEQMSERRIGPVSQYGQQLIKQVVDAAVKNDIYLIIDWHSHNAEEQVEYASEFFEHVAKNYGHLDNIIFEVYNEPKGNWGIAKAPIDDPNVAYTFHYYANTHKVEFEGKNVDEAMKAGYSVFITEWGTGNADGKGTPGVAANNNWQTWVDANKLSWANWSRDS